MVQFLKEIYVKSCAFKRNKTLQEFCNRHTHSTLEAKKAQQNAARAI